MVKPTRWPSLQQRRKLWVEVHLWLGLVLGGFLTIFGITGAVLVFQSEIDHLINPAFFKAEVPPGAQRRSLDEIAQAAMRAAPAHWESGGSTAPKDADENYIFGFWIEGGTPPPEEAVSINIAVNPYTAQVVGRRVFYHAWNPFKHCFIGFFFKLHYALLLGDVGTTVVGIMALLLVISVLSGLILWWPLDGKWRRVLTIKRGASTVRFNHDLHQSVGFYALVVLIAVLISGVYFNLPDQFKWTVAQFSSLTPDPSPSPGRALAPGVSIDRLLRMAETAYPGGTLNYFALPDPKTGLLNACYSDVPSLRKYVVDMRCLTIDANRASVVLVADPASGSAGDTFMQWQWPLHSGQAFGWTGRILVMLSGLMCPLLFVTGILRWLHKRRARQTAAMRRA